MMKFIKISLIFLLFFIFLNIQSSSLDSDSTKIKILFDERSLGFYQDYKEYDCSIESTFFCGCSKLREELEKQGYELHALKSGSLSINRLSKYDILALISINERYTPEEIDTVEKFVESGGGLFLLGDEGNCDIQESISKRFDVHYPHGSFRLIDYVNRYIKESGFSILHCNEYWIVIDDFNNHPITDGIEKICFWRSTFLEPFSQGQILAKSSLFSDAAGEGKKDGPFIVLLSREKGNGKAVFSTCQSFIKNYSIDDLDNKDLILNIFAWLSEKENVSKKIISEKSISNSSEQEKTKEIIDPCASASCPDNECQGYDLWAMKCEDGDCVEDYVIERNSEECGYENPVLSPSNEPLSPQISSRFLPKNILYMIFGIILGSIIIGGSIIYISKKRFLTVKKGKSKISKKKEELRRKLDEDYVEDKISREEYLKRKEELGKS